MKEQTLLKIAQYQCQLAELDRQYWFENLNEKFKMLDCYKTQGERAFMNKDYIFDMARTRGLQIGSQFAECYEAIRVVI